MWSCVNDITGHSKARKLVSEDISLDSINYYFSFALTPQHQSAESFILPPSETSDHGFIFSKVTTSMVLSHLQSLDIRKSAGPVC